MSNNRALIFDMDGVLVDSEPLHLLAYQEILSSFGHGYTEEDNRDFLGRKDSDCCEALVSRFKLDITPEEFGKRKEAVLARLLKERSQIRPGVIKVLSQAQSMGIPMAVASSAKMETIHLVVETLEIKRFFQTLTSGDEVQHGKPAPDVFLLAADRLGVQAKFCLVVEDTFNGVKAAKAAGMQCVAIPCQATKHQDHSLADVILPSLDELDVESWYHSGVL